MITNIFFPFPILTTDRLILRRLTIRDDKEIFILRSDQRVNQFLDREKTISIDDALRFIQKIDTGINNNELIYWGINLINNASLIGTIGYFNISKDKSNAEIGYELFPDFQGKGLMHEAISKVIEFGFQDMGLQTISGYTNPENENSIKLLERNNFKNLKNLSNNMDRKFIIYTLTKFKIDKKVTGN